MALSPAPRVAPHAQVQPPVAPRPPLPSAWGAAPGAFDPRRPAPEGLSSRAFEDDLAERSWQPLAVEGRLPEGLIGTLYRVGPTGFDWPGGRYGHWFDAHGMIHALRVGPGGVAHMNRLVPTEALARDRRQGAPGRSFGTSPGGLWARLKAPFEPFLGTANTNLIPWGDRLYALQEGGMLPFAMGLEDLEALGHERLEGMGPQESFSAHPRWDPVRREVVAASLSYGRKAVVDLVRWGADRRRLGAERLELPYAPALLHDLALSERRAAVLCFPQVTRPLGLLLGTEDLGYGSRWRPELGSWALVVDRDGGLLRRHELPPMFGFHVTNAYDLGQDMAIELVAYGHGDVLGRIGRIRQELPQLQDARLVRLILKAGGGHELEVLAERFLEFPRTLARHQTLAHPEAFYIGERPARRPEQGLSGWMGAVWRLGEGPEAHWAAPEGWVLGEAVPVPKGPGSGEAWLLCLAYRPELHRSSLLVLDGSQLAAGPLAQALLPGHVPPGFHGQFLPA